MNFGGKIIVQHQGFGRDSDSYCVCAATAAAEIKTAESDCNHIRNAGPYV